MPPVSLGCSSLPLLLEWRIQAVGERIWPRGHHLSKVTCRWVPQRPVALGCPQGPPLGQGLTCWFLGGLGDVYPASSMSLSGISSSSSSLSVRDTLSLIVPGEFPHELLPPMARCSRSLSPPGDPAATSGSIGMTPELSDVTGDGGELVTSCRWGWG